MYDETLMHRREILKLGAISAAMPAAISTAWAQQSARTVAASAWRPTVLNAHENETVIALTDLIIPATDTPGAKAAHVNRYIDLFLRDGAPDLRERLIGGLAWLDHYAAREHGHAFVKCPPADQIAILKTLDAAQASGTAPGSAFFRQMKSLTSKIYYATEIGYRELNKGGRVPATFACDHASHG